MYGKFNTRIMDKSYFDIAALVGKYLAGELTEEERERLEEWVSASGERRAWFEAVTGGGYRKEKLERLRGVDTRRGWEEVRKKGAGRVRRWRLWCRYAALFLLPVLGVWFVYERWEGRGDGPAASAVIEAGSSRARLILADGRSVALEEREPGVLTEHDGTRINLEAAHVSYEEGTEEMESEPVYNELVIPRGGEYSLTLSDGTVVYLNAESRLRFPVRFGKGTREVELVGEGYFEVARDTSAAFVVKASDVRVEVLGTVFNLSAYEDDAFACATLVDGRVKVMDVATGEKVVLRPNEQAVVGGGEMTVREVDASCFTAWKDGRLRFQEKPLHEIMRIVSRWYNVEVVYEDEEVKDYVFGCNFSRHAEIADLLAVFERTGTVRFTIQGTRVLIAKRS